VFRKVIHLSLSAAFGRLSFLRPVRVVRSPLHASKRLLQQSVSMP